MATPSGGRTRGRLIRQKLPQPPPVYDQAYLAKLADAVNAYMLQATAPSDVVAARFIWTDPVRIPEDLPDTSTLPTGTVYLLDLPGGSGGKPAYFLTVVLNTDT